MNTKPIRFMLLGLMILLIGGFALVDPTTDLLGIEFVFLLVGIGLGIFGFIQQD
jgi:hypothetical protein